MIHFDGLDFNECRFEEVISDLFWRSVYVNQSLTHKNPPKQENTVAVV